MTRHKTVPFQNPINPDLDLELDPEKELWVLGKKKYFLPGGSTKAIELITWDLDAIVRSWLRPFDIERTLRQNQVYGSWDRECECVPGRGQFLRVPERQNNVAGTWLGIDRSTEPAFRSQPNFRSRYIRIP